MCFMTAQVMCAVHSLTYHKSVDPSPPQKKKKKEKVVFIQPLL